MLVFDNKFSAKVEEIDEVNIQMQMRYVDDTNLAVNVMIEDDFYEEEMLENTSCLSQYLVDFNFSINFLPDIGQQELPWGHKLPILDLNAWVDDKNHILHEFYSKSTTY